MSRVRIGACSYLMACRADWRLSSLALQLRNLRDPLRDVSRSGRAKVSNHLQRELLASLIKTFPEERFSRLKISEGGKLLPPPPPTERDGRSVPSENAASRAEVSATDKSIPNLASTVLLFRYREMTFLHTGDSRADLILQALVSSGLMKRNGRVHVNLLHLPHQGSNRNLTPEFLKRVTADQYLVQRRWHAQQSGNRHNRSTDRRASLRALRDALREP